MDDYISRQAAIEALNENKPDIWTDDDYELGMKNQYESDIAIIKALSSADVTQWTPCYPRFDYIISDHRLHDGDRRILVTYVTKSGKRMVAQVWSERGKIMSTKINGLIVAWMELPEPYKEERRIEQ